MWHRVLPQGAEGRRLSPARADREIRQPLSAVPDQAPASARAQFGREGSGRARTANDKRFVQPFLARAEILALRYNIELFMLVRTARFEHFLVTYIIFLIRFLSPKREDLFIVLALNKRNYLASFAFLSLRSIHYFFSPLQSLFNRFHLCHVILLKTVAVI